MFDTELKYCPKCRDEYMMVAERCAECDVPLLTGGDMAAFLEGKLGGRKGALTEGDDLVTVHKGPLADLKHIAGLCEQENIGTAVVSQSSDCGKG
jgi:hypothetical protein